MNEFLNSLKADLLDRRLLPLLALVGVGLAAAVAYAVLGGGGGSTSPAVLRPHRPAGAVPAGIAVSEAQASPTDAVAETTNGSASQRRGFAHDPFNLLPAAVKAAVASTSTATPSSAASSAASGSSTGGASSGSGSSSKGETAPVAPSKPTAPRKAATIYHVSVLFGALPGGAPQNAQLTPHENLKLLTPLPSGNRALIVFRGVTAGGKSATFTVVGETILHGQATCLPSSAQCQEINLKPGQTEQLEYLPPNGQPVTYELRVSNITSSKASAASIERILRDTSKAGGALLRRAGRVAVPGLRYSSVAGVLTSAGGAAHPARAHG